MPAQATDFSPLQSVQNGSGAHPATYPISTGDVFSRVTWLVFEADHIPLSPANIRNEHSNAFTSSTSLYSVNKNICIFISLNTKCKEPQKPIISTVNLLNLRFSLSLVLKPLLSKYKSQHKTNIKPSSMFHS
jgi:hypothetical protein